MKKIIIGNPLVGIALIEAFTQSHKVVVGTSDRRSKSYYFNPPPQYDVPKNIVLNSQINIADNIKSGRELRRERRKLNNKKKR